MKLRHLAPVGVAAVLALVVSGCSTGGGDASPTDNTFVYAIGEPDHLTPGRQTVAFEVVTALFAPLVALDQDNNVTYVQAESVESDDATNWTITLRDGWTFHNGEPVTAQSYVDAWNFEALGTNAWENAGQLANIVGYNDVHPAEGDPTAETLSGLAVVDDLTFTVELVGPDSQFPLQLSTGQTGFYPMPAAAYDDLDAYDRQPIGNGPFMLSEPWEDNTEFDAVAYADYAGDAPLVDGVTFRPYADVNTAYTDVLAGNADLQFLPSSKTTSAGGEFGDRLYSFPAPGIDYLGFPLWDDRFSKEVRQAISMSIDRDAVNEAIFGGLYEPATALTPPAMSGTPVGICGEFCEFDPEAAKALLEEAGGWTGTLELVYPGGIGLDELYEAYANQIRQNLGIEDVVTAPSTDWASYFQTLTDKTVTGPHFGHWGALYQSQQNTLRALFTAAGGCAACTGFYSSPDVDALLAQADGAGSTDEANEFYAQVQERVLEDFPVVPTFFDTYSYVTSDKIATLPAVAGSPLLAQITLK